MDAVTVAIVWQALQTRFHTRTKAKHKSLFMQLIAWFLALIRVLPRRSFLHDFTTTIGHTIYTSFDPTSVPVDPWNRLLLCVHEHQHVVQWQRGPLRFVLGYLLWPRRRAELEA